MHEGGVLRYRMLVWTVYLSPLRELS
jgi:hypothetical protein